MLHTTVCARHTCACWRAVAWCTVSCGQCINWCRMYPPLCTSKMRAIAFAHPKPLGRSNSLPGACACTCIHTYVYLGCIIIRVRYYCTYTMQAVALIVWRLWKIVCVTYFPTQSRPLQRQPNNFFATITPRTRYTQSAQTYALRSK